MRSLIANQHLRKHLYFTGVLIAAGLISFTCSMQNAVHAQSTNAPNVLFIISDDLNNDLGAYGHQLVKSPNIDRLASRGVLFESAYVQYPVCNPSRSSLLTGMYPEQTGVTRNGHNFRDRLPDTPTLPQWFRQHGYYTARVGKIFHYGVPGQIGTDGKDDPASWDEVVNPRGVDKDVENQIKTIVPGQFGGTLSWLRVDSERAHTDELGADAAIRILEDKSSHDTGKPFFLAVGFYRPHTPYVAPGKYFDLYERDNIDPVIEPEGHRNDKPVAALRDRPRQLQLTVNERKEIIEAYYASISLMDDQVGRILDALDRLELTEQTIVVFTSDHGYHLGRHGLWQKGDLFEGSLRVPLIIAEPDTKHRGRNSQALVELVDLYPTLVNLCGLPEPGHLRGNSLVPVLSNPEKDLRDTAFSIAWSGAGSQHPDLRGIPIMGYSIRTDRFRYTEWADGRHGIELYDYSIDPTEQTNRAGFPELATEQAELKKKLQERVQLSR